MRRCERHANETWYEGLDRDHPTLAVVVAWSIMGGVPILFAAAAWLLTLQ